MLSFMERAADFQNFPADGVGSDDDFTGTSFRPPDVVLRERPGQQDRLLGHKAEVACMVLRNLDQVQISAFVWLLFSSFEVPLRWLNPTSIAEVSDDEHDSPYESASMRTRS